MDIEGWLRGLGLQQYVTAFRENNVEAEVLLRLTAEDIKRRDHPKLSELLRG